MGKLDIGTTDHLDRFHDRIRLFLKALLQLLRNREHGRRAIRVAGMDAHGIHILDEADRDHLVFRVADHFQLQFFPTQYRFFNQHLVDHAHRQPATGHGSQLLHIVYQSAAGAAHRVSRTDHYGIAQPGRYLLRIFNRIDRRAFRHFYPQTVHGPLKGNAVLPPFNGVDIYADHLDAILIQHPAFGQLQGQVQRRLSTKIRQQRIRTFLPDNFRKRILI